MARVDDTKEYLNKKLKEYTKEELIDAMFLKLDYIQVDRIADGCWQIRNMRKMEADARREEREAKVLKERIEEYNKLVEESNKVGIVNMPPAKINRMAALIKIIRNGGRK